MIARCKSNCVMRPLAETLADLFLVYGPPQYIRSNNRAEFTASDLT
jgi:hypothetical protein